MSDIVCPICLGQSFVEFRGRENAQCVSCNSLERHRLFKLFLLWIGSSHSNLFLSTVGPLEKLAEYESWLTVERLEKIDEITMSAVEANNTCVFLENIVGFKEIEPIEVQRIRTMMSSGALMAFTCHSGFEEKRKSDVTKLLGNDVNHIHFDPRAVYGESVSEEFALNLGSMRRGRGDIYYYQSECVETDIEQEQTDRTTLKSFDEEVISDHCEGDYSKQWSHS